MSTYTEALRRAADFLADHEDLFGTSHTGVRAHFDADDMGIFLPTWNGRGEKVDQKAILRKVVRTLGGTFEKGFNGSTMYLTQEGLFGFFNLTIFADRDGVCERKLVGTREVEVPAMKAAKARVDTVPVYEWECKSIFADDAPAPEMFPSTLDALDALTIRENVLA
jgi:hypothetical protein